MKFKLIGGSHVQGGVAYSKGDIIDTEIPLDKNFAGKFERLPEYQEAPGVVGKASVPGKKEKVAQANSEPPMNEQTDDVDLGAAQPAPTEEKGPEGEEVTSSFKVAVEQDFRVFKKGVLYFVYDKDAMGAGPVNEEGVKRSQVKVVIQEALE